MREIKFRGFSKKDNQWFYGLLTKVTTLYDEKYYIEDDKYISSVDIASIGQYTGFNYQNGQKIYEGDYVEDKDLNISGFVRFSAGRWCVEDVCEPLEEKELCAIYDLIDFKGTEYEAIKKFGYLV